MESPKVQAPNCSCSTGQPPQRSNSVAHPHLNASAFPYQNGEHHQPYTWAEEEAARHQSLLANLPALLYRCALDEAGTALLMSEGCATLTGYPTTDFIDNRQRSLADLVAPEDREQVAHQLQQAIAQRQPYMLEYRILHANGMLRWVADRGTVVTDEQRANGWRDGLLIDISLQKESEAILSKVNKALVESSRNTGEFLANVSHEIRTPLSVMLTIAESLQEGIYGAATPRQSEALGRLRRSGRHLLGLVNDILDMAKMAAGKLTLYPARVAVETVCTHSLQMVQELAQNKQITLSYTNDDQVEWLWADEQRLRQILVNLLSNGIKFTPTGGKVGLTVTADPAQEVLRLTVWDTGIGIAQAESATIFQPFVQLDTTLSSPYEGTGLGLPLVYYLTRLHEGGIMLETTEGEGSRFTVALPRQKEEALPAESISTVFDEATKIHLLALTSDATTAQQLTTALRIYAIEVTATDDLRNAIALACQQPLDLFLVEAPLPDYTLLDTIHQLRMFIPAPKAPPLILTTVQTPGHEPLWQQLGAVTALHKPISFKQLAAFIHASVTFKRD